MLLTIRHHGRTVGQAEVREEGLYWHIRAVCEGPVPYLSRLYLHSRSLGILQPEGDMWTLCRTLPRKSLELDAGSVLTLEPEPQMRPFRGFLGPYPANGAYRCADYLYFPAQPTEPFPILSLFCFFEMQVLDGKAYLCIRQQPEYPILEEPEPEK